jgi:hypothetical protein
VQRGQTTLSVLPRRARWTTQRTSHTAITRPGARDRRFRELQQKRCFAGTVAAPNIALGAKTRWGEEQRSGAQAPLGRSRCRPCAGRNTAPLYRAALHPF